LREQEGVAARALEFMILTAARTGETTGASRAEINPAAKVWTIPASRMKAGREHRVPLPPRALTIIDDVVTTDTKFVFPGGKLGKPLSNMAMTSVLRRMDRGDITVHGFRSTFRDWAAERTNYPREVVEMALAHAIGDKVEAAYRRGDLFEKRRRLMSEWANYCARGNAAATVVPLRHRAGQYPVARKLSSASAARSASLCDVGTGVN
jgi:integrase